MLGKIILGRKKTAAVLAVLVMAALFLTFNFTSTCACLNPDEEFTRYVGLSSPGELRSDLVKNGFEKHFPRGSYLVPANLLHLGSDAEQSFTRSENVFVCKYWIESSAVAKRGYRIEIQLSGDDKILGIKANAISSWFGMELNWS